MNLKLNSISDPDEGLKWTIVHIALGFVSAYFKYAFIAYFYMAVLQNYKVALKQSKSGNLEQVTLMISYLLGFELLNRVVQGSPFVPVEYSKYITVFVFGYLAFISRKNFHPIGTALLVLAFPGVLYDESNQVVLADIVNGYLPPVGLAIGVGLWGSIKPTDDLITNSMRLLWFGTVTVLTCIVIRTPSYDDLTFTLAASKATSGGTSSNQASTILGLGMFLSFYSFYGGYKFSGKRVLDIVFMMAFALQGLLTFSRGGVLVGVIAIVFLILFPSGSKNQDPGKKAKAGAFGKNLLFLALGIGFLLMAFTLVDKLTGGLLSLRYKGETAGTAAGYAEKDLDKITSGRSEIFLYDIEIWLEHPLLGVGSGASPYFRLEREGALTAPHVELSRLLADQGMLGLIYFIILLLLGVSIWMKRKLVPQSDLLMALYIIALATSFHAAMRTFVTPFFMTLSAMSLSPQLNVKPKPGKDEESGHVVDPES